MPPPVKASEKPDPVGAPTPAGKSLQERLQWMDTPQTAKLAGLSVHTLKSVRTGRRKTPTPPWTKDTDGRVWYRLSDVRDFVESRPARPRKQ